MSHNDRRAKRGQPFTTDDPGSSKLQKTIEFYLTKYRHFDSDSRIQALVFYTDYRYYQEHGEQLTEAHYKPYAYGFYSDDIRTVLQDAVNHKTNIVSDGKRTTRYYAIPNANLSDAPVSFLEQMHAETEDVSLQNLQLFAKNSTLFEATPYNSFAEFCDETVDPPK